MSETYGLHANLVKQLLKASSLQTRVLVREKLEEASF